jgi:dephospho-CoA kinase
MFVIGLAGGIACGKSLVAECLKDLGCVIIDADKVGHQVLCMPSIVGQIAQKWGGRVVVDGKVDRRELAKIVFPSGADSPTEALKYLEQLTHPEIGRLVQQRLEQYEASGQFPAVVLDAPLMFKANWDRFCDRIVFIDADLQTRKQRALERGWSETELERRESYQMPVEQKRERSTDLITNSGSVEELKQQLRQLWRQWNIPA